MTYEEFLIYSARLGEFDDVKFCIDEKVDLDSKDESGNTALRMLSTFFIFPYRYVSSKWTFRNSKVVVN